VRSCSGDRRRVLDIKHPDLCPAIDDEPRATDDLDCFNATLVEKVSRVTR
jgi:hypothetical protein